jgi:hypothetical protein
VLEIERVSWRRPVYAVRADGHSGTWVRRRFAEEMTGEIDGDSFEFRREGRGRFTLVSSAGLLATAEVAGRGRWTMSVDEVAYVLRRRSRWRSDMELCRGGIAVGSIRKGRGRGRVVCDLPAELSPARQAFIGFVVLVLWNRAAASDTSGAVAASG